MSAVSPGCTRTQLVLEGLQRSGGGEDLAAVEAEHALRRIGEPAEVAEVVCFLGSLAASFVAGADWVVDGGISARCA